MAKEKKVDQTSVETVSVPVAEPETPVLSPREIAWKRLVEKYREQFPVMYDKRVAEGEDFSKIPNSFQGVMTTINGKETIY